MVTKGLAARALAVAAAAALSTPALAAVFTPPQADLLAMTVGFGAGTIQSIAPDGAGALMTATLGSEGTFSRVVPQKANFNSDLSTFTGFGLTITSLGADVTGMKMYVQTGAGFAFKETAFQSLSSGQSVDVILDFAALNVADTNNVRQFGIQFFGGPGEFPGQQVRMTPLPEPGMLSGLALLAGAMIARRR